MGHRFKSLGGESVITMSAQLDLDARTDRPTLPDTINSANAKLVYFYVTVQGETTVSDLQTDLGLGKMSLFSVLDSLHGAGHVERNGQRIRPA